MTRKPFGLGIAICASLIAVLTGCGSGPAVPSDAVPAGAAAGGNGAATAPSCTPTVVFGHVTDVGTALDVTDIETAINDTDNTATFTLTNQHSKTVSIEETTKRVSSFTASVSATVGFSLPIKWLPSASITAAAAYTTIHETDSTVQQAVGVTAGSQLQITIPADATGYVLYGVDVQVVHGVLQSSGCSSFPQQTSEAAFIPMHFGYCAFVRGPDQFTNGGYGTDLAGNCQIINYDL
jgi:hypothetical protein